MRHANARCGVYSSDFKAIAAAEIGVWGHKETTHELDVRGCPGRKHNACKRKKQAMSESNPKSRESDLGLMGTQQRPHLKLHATDAETFFDLLMRWWAAESMARRSSYRNHMNQGLDLSTGLDTESRCFARVVTNSVVVPHGELDISCCSQPYHFLQFQS